MPTTKSDDNKVRVTYCIFCVCCGEPIPIGEFEFESLTNSVKMCVKCRDAVMAMRNLREGRDNSDDGK